MVLGSSYSIAFGSMIGSKRLHDGMLHNILRSPMSFFDTTPLGRILNRFSKASYLELQVHLNSILQDIYTIDELIPRSMSSFLMTFFNVFATLIVISIASPWFLIAILPLVVFYGFVQVYTKLDTVQVIIVFMFREFMLPLQDS